MPDKDLHSQNKSHSTDKKITSSERTNKQSMVAGYGELEQTWTLLLLEVAATCWSLFLRPNDMILDKKC